MDSPHLFDSVLLASKLTELAADPDHRFGGATSRPHSLQSYVSSEATDLELAPLPEIPWDLDRENRKLWQEHFEEQLKTKKWQVAAEAGRQFIEQREEELFRRTGLRLSLQGSYRLESALLKLS
jgi:hypothetical protein